MFSVFNLTCLFEAIYLKAYLYRKPLKTAHLYL